MRAKVNPDNLKINRLSLELKAKNKREREFLRKIVDNGILPTGAISFRTDDASYSENVTSIDLHFDFE